MIASSTPSEIWSAILSGWPSVTDSDVNRYSLSWRGESGRMKGRFGLRRSTAGSGEGYREGGSGAISRFAARVVDKGLA
jgi:hypothetical protein